MSAPEFRWILPSVVKAVQKELIATHGGMPGIRDNALLESALARAQNFFAYNQQATAFELAACYSVGLAKNHPFVDGKKRIALTIGVVFLELHGYLFSASEADAVIVFNQVAAGKMDERSLAIWFEKNSERD